MHVVNALHIIKSVVILLVIEKFIFNLYFHSLFWENETKSTGMVPCLKDVWFEIRNKNISTTSITNVKKL